MDLIFKQQNKRQKDGQMLPYGGFFKSPANEAAAGKTGRFAPGYWRDDDNFLRELLPFCRFGKNGKVIALPAYTELDAQKRSDLRNAIKRRGVGNVILLLDIRELKSGAFRPPKQFGRAPPVHNEGYWFEWQNLVNELKLLCECDSDGLIIRLPKRNELMARGGGIKHGLGIHGGAYKVAQRLARENMVSPGFVMPKKMGAVTIGTWEEFRRRIMPVCTLDRRGIVVAIPAYDALMAGTGRRKLAKAYNLFGGEEAVLERLARETHDEFMQKRIEEVRERIANTY